MIIGSTQSGVQIAEELIEAGRPVYLCTSEVGRSLRQYWGSDVLYCGIATGNLYQTVTNLEDPNMQFATQGQASGIKGGHTISLQQLVRDGAVLLGGLKGASEDRISLSENLIENCNFSDGVSRRRNVQVDASIEQKGIDDSPGVDDPVDAPGPDLLAEPVRQSMELNQKGITTVIWCTGFTADFSWIQGLDLTSRGAPVHTDGLLSIPGLCFNGLPWLRNRASGLIYGGVRDSEHIASMITGAALEFRSTFRGGQISWGWVSFPVIENPG